MNKVKRYTAFFGALIAIVAIPYLIGAAFSALLPTNGDLSESLTAIIGFAVLGLFITGLCVIAAVFISTRIRDKIRSLS